MYFGLQPDAGHTERLFDALLGVDDVFLGQDMENSLIGGNGDCLGRIYYPFDVWPHYFAIANGDDAV